MRYLVLSDIHGGATELEQALTYFDKYKCDFLVLLGDLLNHGPRNYVPESYKPPRVVELLNPLRTKIMSIRGNCDSEVDSMLFNFPCNAPYGYINVPYGDGQMQRIFLTHGHLFKFNEPEEKAAIAVMEKLGLAPNDIVLSGHTHVSGVWKYLSGLVNINPGSTTIPKGNTPAGFGLILEDRIELRDLNDALQWTYDFASHSETYHGALLS